METVNNKKRKKNEEDSVHGRAMVVDRTWSDRMGKKKRKVMGSRKLDRAPGFMKLIMVQKGLHKKQSQLRSKKKQELKAKNRAKLQQKREAKVNKYNTHDGRSLEPQGVDELQVASIIEVTNADDKEARKLATAPDEKLQQKKKLKVKKNVSEDGQSLKPLGLDELQVDNIIEFRNAYDKEARKLDMAPDTGPSTFLSSELDNRAWAGKIMVLSDDGFLGLGGSVADTDVEERVARHKQGKSKSKSLDGVSKTRGRKISNRRRPKHGENFLLVRGTGKGDEDGKVKRSRKLHKDTGSMKLRMMHASLHKTKIKKRSKEKKELLAKHRAKLQQKKKMKAMKNKSQVGRSVEPLSVDKIQLDSTMEVTNAYKEAGKLAIEAHSDPSTILSSEIDNRSWAGKTIVSSSNGVIDLGDFVTEKDGEELASRNSESKSKSKTEAGFSKTRSRKTSDNPKRNRRLVSVESNGKGQEGKDARTVVKERLALTSTHSTLDKSIEAPVREKHLKAKGNRKTSLRQNKSLTSAVDNSQDVHLTQGHEEDTTVHLEHSLTSAGAGIDQDLSATNLDEKQAEISGKDLLHADVGPDIDEIMDSSMLMREVENTWNELISSAEPESDQDAHANKVDEIVEGLRIESFKSAEFEGHYDVPSSYETGEVAVRVSEPSACVELDIYEGIQSNKVCEGEEKIWKVRTRRSSSRVSLPSMNEELKGTRDRENTARKKQKKEGALHESNTSESTAAITGKQSLPGETNDIDENLVIGVANQPSTEKRKSPRFATHKQADSNGNLSLPGESNKTDDNLVIDVANQPTIEKRRKSPRFATHEQTDSTGKQSLLGERNEIDDNLVIGVANQSTMEKWRKSPRLATHEQTDPTGKQSLPGESNKTDDNLVIDVANQPTIEKRRKSPRFATHEQTDSTGKQSLLGERNEIDDNLVIGVANQSTMEKWRKSPRLATHEQTDPTGKQSLPGERNEIDDKLVIDVVNQPTTEKRRKSPRLTKREQTDSCLIENKVVDEKVVEQDLEEFGTWETDRLRPGVVFGKYSAEEDEALKKAVFDFIREKDWEPEDGLRRVMNPRLYREQGVWSAIRKCLPHRTVRQINSRAQRLLNPGTRLGSWNGEEISLLKKLHEAHGNKWKSISQVLGREKGACKDKWRALNAEKKEERRKLRELIYKCVYIKRRLVKSEEKPNYKWLRDDINWKFIAERMEGRNYLQCLKTWYKQMASPMISTGDWSIADDQVLLERLSEEFPLSEESVNWDTLLEHRVGDTCRKRWEEMKMKASLGDQEFQFLDALRILVERHAPHLLEENFDEQFAVEMQLSESHENVLDGEA